MSTDLTSLTVVRATPVSAAAREIAAQWDGMPDPYQFATDGADPPPTVASRVRAAVRELRNLEPAPDGTIMTDGAHLDLVCDLLDEAIELDAAHRAIETSPGVTTDDAGEVQRLVDDLDERPHRVAVRLLALERQVALLAERSMLYPRPLGAS